MPDDPVTVTPGTAVPTGEYGILGQGFDVFGALDDTSSLEQVVDTTFDNSEVDGASGTSEFFDSFSARSEYSSKLGVRLGLEGSYARFSGQFELSFQGSTTDNRRSYYALYQKDTTIRRARLTSFQALAKGFQANVADLPQTFDPANPQPFYRVFDRYGVVFVSQVLFGGQLSLSTWIDRDFEMSAVDLKAQAGLAYSGFFSSVEATAKSAWSQTEKVWREHATMLLTTKGGDPTIHFGRATPNAWYGENIDAWVKSLPQYAVAVGYKLTPLASLFAGPQGVAVRQASLAYASRVIDLACDPVHNLEVDFTGASMSINGVPFSAERQNRGTVQVAILDRSTGAPRVPPAVFRLQNDNWRTTPELLGAFSAAMAPFTGNPDVIICLNFYRWQVLGDDLGPVFALLQSIGAEKGIEMWCNHPMSSPGLPQGMNYSIVGIPGMAAGMARESITRTMPVDPVRLGVYLVAQEDHGGAVKYMPR